MNRFISSALVYFPATLMKGENIYRYYREYKSLEFASSEDIKSYQLSRLQSLCSYVYENSSFYRDLYDRAGFKPDDLVEFESIKKIPFVTKEDLSGGKLAIEPSRFERLFSTSKTTGGSTGNAVTLLKSSTALARERAATWIGYGWAGVGFGAPQARFWGVPLSSLNQLKYKVIDFIANRKRFSAFNMSDVAFDHFHGDLDRFKPLYLYGYASVIHAYILFLKRSNRHLPNSVKSIITTSEVLTEEMRNSIETFSGLKVFNEYGCGEVGSIAHQCEHGSLHVMDQNLILEIDSDSGPGEIVVTDLFNTLTPLIRYRLSDYSEVKSEACKCGRSWSQIKGVYGRAYDLIRHGNGTKVHPEYFMYVFEKIKDELDAINSFQVEQVAIKSFVVRLILGNESLLEDCKLIIERLFKEKLGDDIVIEYEFPEFIPREKSGKLRIIKSALQ